MKSAVVRSVLPILMLLAGGLSPPGVAAQNPGGVPDLDTAGRAFMLEQNYPNPVNPETWIPFYLDAELFRDRDQVPVTIRIYNILSQVVAIPEAMDHPRGQGTRVINLPYTQAGRNIAYWDGKDLSGRQVPSGVYYIQMVVDEEPQTRKLVVLNERRRRRIFPW